jgi:hypothetical protein
MGTSLINGNLKVKTKEDIDRLENLLVVQNRVKKGIEIPDVEISISQDQKSIIFGAIDKIKYADFLSIPDLWCFGYFSKEGEGLNYIYEYYTGDEITLNMNDPECFVSGLYGLSYYKTLEL